VVTSPTPTRAARGRRPRRDRRESGLERPGDAACRPAGSGQWTTSRSCSSSSACSSWRCRRWACWRVGSACPRALRPGHRARLRRGWSRPPHRGAALRRVRRGDRRRPAPARARAWSSPPPSS
jgi:hypothetical protein